MRKMLSVITAVLLVLWGVPLHAYADDDAPSTSAPQSQQRTDVEIESSIAAMIAAGDYIEGEAVVCSTYARPENVRLLSAKSDDAGSDLLSSSEPLSMVSAQQYSEATGAVIPVSEQPMLFSARSVQEPVRITLVHRDDMTTQELLETLLRDPRVLSAEPNYCMSFEEADDAPASDDSSQLRQPTPNGGLLLEGGATSPDLTAYQWFSSGVASTVPAYIGAENPGVHAPDWNSPGMTNADGVVVILDSGIDYTHPDLENVMYHFSPELQAELGCGEFGYAPDRYDQTNPLDGYGHGTHCAGIVAAEWNDFGVSGIASGIKIFSVCVSQSMSDGNFSYSTIIKGYDFIIRAAQAGVDIRAINRSIEKTPTNNASQAMVQAAGELGIVTVIASGNKNTDIDTAYSDVAMYQSSPYILRVNAARLQDDRAWFSNYGMLTTDVFAPGVAILSTVPSVDVFKSRYFPQADDDPLFMETSFDSGLLDISGDELYRSFVNSTSQGDISVDGDGKSLAVDTTITIERGSAYYLDVPTGILDADELQNISIALYAPDVVFGGIEFGLLLDDDSYTIASKQDNISMNASCGWCFAGLRISPSTFMNHGIRYVEDSQGRTCIRLRIYASISRGVDDFGKEVDTTIYFDQIAIGKSGNSGQLPYQYMDGTSMAAPCVTGCAAIVSSLVQATSPAERAALTVRTLKESVRQAEGYFGYCQQNGQIDLSLIDASDKPVPVLETADVSDDTIVIEGAGFGDEEGTLLVGDVQANVVSWSDDTVVVQWPSSVPSGLIPLTVVTTTGAEACRAFILESPEPAAGDVLLYERDLAPFSIHDTQASAMASPSSMTATDDGMLFAAVPDVEDGFSTAVRYLMSSSDQGESWSAHALPEELGNVSIAAGDGEVFVFGATPPDDTYGVDSWSLYRFDIALGTFTLLRTYEQYGSEIETPGTIAVIDGNLYIIDCCSDPDDFDAPKRMRIKRFASDYSLGEGQLLDHGYYSGGLYDAPKVAVSGTSVYVLGLDEVSNYATQEETHGLERLDLNDDGTFTCTDLSSAITSIECDGSDICMASCDLGVFLIGNGLGPLLPEGEQHTDTFLLKTGTTSFEPYDRTLSYASVHTPACVYADGWLYAYAASRYEEFAQFGRATNVIPDEYEIRFLNDDGTVLQTMTVKEGELPAYTGSTPTKEATAQYTYTFAGWDPEILKASADADYRATFAATLNAYEITFVLTGGSLDGLTGDVKATHDYGTLITLPSPTRDGYVFAYWEGSRHDAGESYTVEGDHTFTAIWEKEGAPAAPDDSSQPSDGKALPGTSDSATGLASSAACFALLSGIALAIAVIRRKEINR